MNSLRLLGIVAVFVLIGLGTVGGCGSSGDGETSTINDTLEAE